jgi:hypothetical protein
VRRRLLILAVFLLAGVVVNLAVAWGCAIFADLASGSSPAWRARSKHYPASFRSEPFFGASRWQTAVAERVYVYRRSPDSSMIERGLSEPSPEGETRVEDWIPAWSLPFFCRLDPDAPEGRDYWTADATGWPRLCLFGGIEQFYPASINEPEPLLTWYAYPLAAPSSNAPLGVKMLPLHPIWPGFLLNTLFYAVLLWLLICGPFVVRRTIRARRGLSPKCAYPVGESNTCTECGTALPARRVAM